MKKRTKNGWMFLSVFMACQGALADNWMGRLPDNAYVAQLSIPGTHDTATGEGFIDEGIGETWSEQFSRAQDVGLSVQWEAGVRAFDFRPACYKDEYLNCAHGMSHTKMTFRKALETLRDSLAANPTEFAVLHILRGTDLGEGGDYETMLHELLGSEDLKDCFVDFRRDLTVADMRGKMLLLYRDAYDTDPVGGMMTNWCGWIDWNSQTNGLITGAGTDAMAAGALYMQDLSDTHEDGKLDEKKDAIRKMLDYTTTHVTTDPRRLVWVYNFASAYSKVGIFNISLSNGYRDNATHTNAAIIDYLTDEANLSGPTGIVLMDYACVATSGEYQTRGDELVNLLIEQNFKYIHGLPESEPGTVRAVSFRRDDNRDYTGKMGMEAKNGIPLLADFDGNGLTDVYFGGEGYFYDSGADSWNWGDGGYLAYAQGEGSSPAWVTLSNTSASSATPDLPLFYGGLGSRALDFDQDGAVDLLLLDNQTGGWSSLHPNQGRGALRLLRNKGGDAGLEDVTAEAGDNVNWPYLSVVDGRLNSGNPLHCIAVADVNLDGYPDVLFQGETLYGSSLVEWQRLTKLYLNDGNGGFVEDTESQIMGANGGAVLFGDFNNDGYPDAVVSGYSQGGSLGDFYLSGGARLDFYKNDGKGHLVLANTDLNDNPEWTSQQYGHSDEECVMYVIDYDQDGRQDLLIIGSFGCSDEYAEGNGKAAVVLRNVSTDDRFAFEPVKAGIWPTSGNATGMSALADFNGDGFPDYMARGWGKPNADGSGYEWSDYCSYSTGKGTFETVWGIIDVEEGYMNYGDVDGDGMLDFMSPCNDDNSAPYFYRNTCLLGTGDKVQVPDAPTGVEYSYDPDTKRLTLAWDRMETVSGSKAVYNVYIVRGGQTFMRCPAVKETGTQTACTPFAAYLPSETCFFENVEPGEYEIGVQSVSYSWNASPFTVMTVQAEGGGDGVAPVSADGNGLVDVYTLGGVRLKKDVDESRALDGLPKGIYVVGTKASARKVIK